MFLGILRAAWNWRPLFFLAMARYVLQNSSLHLQVLVSGGLFLACTRLSLLFWSFCKALGLQGNNELLGDPVLDLVPPRLPTLVLVLLNSV